MTIKLATLIKASAHTGPRYRIIADTIADAVASGTLAKGERLPPMRDLAFALSVTTGTIARAYALGVTRQQLASEVGRGTYVRGAETDAAPSLARPAPVNETGGAITMKANLPAALGQADKLTHEAALMLTQSDHKRFDYLPTGGTNAQREAGAGWLTTGTFAPTPDNVLLCSGAQQAILTAILATTEPGDLILTEALTYHAITAQALMLGRRVAPVEMDEDGLVPEALAKACRGSRVTALFTVPTLHNPTTITMSAKRRAAIAEIAASQQLSVIEDDIYANLMDERPEPLAHLIPKQTYYLNSLSKAVSPGLRVAYLVSPREQHERVRAILHGLGQTLPPLMAELASRIIANGTAAMLVAQQRTEIAARNDLASRTLRDAPRRQAKAAMHLWLQLPEHWRAGAFVEAARHRGVLIAGGEEFMVGRPDQAARHVRLCLGAAANRSKLEQGLKIISELMSETPFETHSLA